MTEQPPVHPDVESTPIDSSIHRPRTAEPVAFPDIHSALAPESAAQAVRALSKSGRLPGYRDASPTSFASTIFGGIYDHTLRATITPAGAPHHASTVAATISLNRKTPAVVIAATLLTIWPGGWLLHSLLTTYFSAYPRADWVTWAWYLPLCLLSIPFLWKQFKAARLEARAHALEIHGRLAAALDTQPHRPSTAIHRTSEPAR